MQGLNNCAATPYPFKESLLPATVLNKPFEDHAPESVKASGKTYIAASAVIEKVSVPADLCGDHDGRIVAGKRHGDCIKLAIGRYNFKKPVKSDQQGFVDQFGKFYTRRQAIRVAHEAGQIPGQSTDGVLISENVW